MTDQTADLIATARGVQGMYVEWRRQTHAGLRQARESAVPLYERTRHFRVYEPGVIPGLLQTPAYAAALMGSIIAFQGIPDDTEQAAAARIERQAVMHRNDRTFAFLIEESALRARFGDDATMAGQYGHLLYTASLPRVSVGIIPCSTPRGMWPVEGFWIFDDERVLVELVTAEITVTQPREIDLYARTFAALAEMAVRGAAAHTVIASALAALDE